MLYFREQLFTKTHLRDMHSSTHWRVSSSHTLTEMASSCASSKEIKSSLRHTLSRGNLQLPFRLPRVDRQTFQKQTTRNTRVWSPLLEPVSPGTTVLRGHKTTGYVLQDVGLSRCGCEGIRLFTSALDPGGESREE